MMPTAAIAKPCAMTLVRRLRGCAPSARRMPNSRVLPLTENTSTPATPIDRNGQSHCGEAAEDECVQTIGSENFGADVVERGGVFDRLIHG